METWLPLTDYSSKYKISVSTLRRRIKTDDIKYHFQDGKYFIYDEPLKNSTQSSPSLNSIESVRTHDDKIFNDLENAEAVNIDKIYSNLQQPVILAQTYNPDFLENLKRSAHSKLPQLKSQSGVLGQQAAHSAPAINIDEEYYFRKEKASIPAATNFEQIPALTELPNKISKGSANEPVLTAANKILNELKKAYTQVLHEKEEQMMILKEEVSDLKTLVKALERENERLKQNW